MMLLLSQLVFPRSFGACNIEINTKDSSGREASYLLILDPFPGEDWCYF
jgi:hypothetical protein